MATSPKQGGVFLPSDLALMGQAYDSALRLVKSEHTRFTHIPASVLEFRIAWFIVASGREGPIDVDCMAERALKFVLAIEISPLRLVSFGGRRDKQYCALT